ncbi:MAG: hypothetical protein FWE58_05275, partial [Methanobrevibacter sp.]|nr:hypothetical protein [Methanobrevibacter sp.]
MMKNKNVNKSILIIIAMVLLLAFSLQFSFATSINDTDDEGIKGALDSDDFVGTIHLNPGNYSGINNTNITVERNVTFQGNGSPDKVVIDGKNSNWLFNIEDNLNVKFINITFRNAVADDGAAIFNGFNSNITFINCIFENNFADNGGAIYNNKGTITMENSLFINNRVSGDATGFLIDGDSLGGAIYNSGTFTLSYSNFTNNSANFGGGAIYNSGDMIVSDCNFNDNNALANCFIEILYPKNPLPSDDDEDDDGIMDLPITESIVIDSFGGAIYNSGTFTLSYSNFTNNGANFGGAIYNSGDMIVSDCNFNDNNALAICVNEMLNQENQIILQLLDGNADDSQCLGIHINSFGGAIYNDGIFTLSYSNFTNNTANEGGAIYNDGTFTLNYSNFTNNTANFYGGGIFNSGNMNVSGNTMTGNLAGIGIGEVDEIFILDAKIDDEAYGNVIYNIGNMGGLVLTYLNNPVMNVKLGENIILYAYLTDDMNNPITGGDISFYVDNDFKDNVFVNEGQVNIDYTPNILGTIPVHGEYTGGLYDIIIKPAHITIRLSTSTTIVVPNNLKAGDKITINGVLTDEKGNSLSNTRLTVVVGGQTQTVRTGSNGTWSLNFTITTSGNHIVSVNFAGNNTHIGFNSTANFNADKVNTITTLLVPDNAKVNQDTIIRGVLTDVQSNSLANAEIIVTVNDKSYQITTNNNGVWSLSYTPTISGKNNVSVTYAGNNAYFSSSNSNSFDIEKGKVNIDTNITENSDGSVTVKARVTDENKIPMFNHPVEITVDGKLFGIR